MRTSCFDAVLKFSPADRDRPSAVSLLIRGEKIPASLFFYEQVQQEKLSLFVLVQTRRPVLLKWKDKFKARGLGKTPVVGEGQVLSPLAEKISRGKIRKRIAFLQRLQGDRKEMLLALVQGKGLKGLKEREITDFCSLTTRILQRLAQELEAEGKIRILTFSSLFLLSQESLDYLCQNILRFLAQFHQRQPEQKGVSLEIVKTRFELDPRIFSLALKHLSRTGQIKEFGDKLAVPEFTTILSPEEEGVLRKLEDLCFKGEFRSYSFEDLRKLFRLSSSRLDRLLSLLVERKKIVQGKDGLIIHSKWLDEIISRIEKSRKRELTVADFKELTGLTRKYAIPLLELLDQMGVTRRKGRIREIL
jgi:selenocysteine-specific elongation factor